MTPTRMRPFRETIPLAAARALIAGAIAPLERTERIPLAAANGRAIARDVVATRDVPPFARAAMDGYAVRAADTLGATRSEPRILRRVETVYTGQIAGHRVAAGECIEIATGAPMPAGADAVVMVEDTEEGSNGTVRIFGAVQPQQHVGRQGADIACGQVVLRAGEVLNSSRIGALAAIGTAEIDVYQQPRVAIISTGNELVEPGQPLQQAQIYDVNRFTLAAVVSDHGGIPVPYPRAADTLDGLRQAIEGSLREDIIVCSGGSSVGEKDLVLDAIAACGEVLFHGISVKPGKPTAFGIIGGKPIFGMPGYPASCLTNAHILLVPLLRAIARLGPQRIRTVSLPLAQRVVSAPGRHQFYTVRIENGEALPAFKASGDITSMSQADGYIEIPAEVDALERGTIVEVILF